MSAEDAAYLRAFEELVQSQQPASEPWQPVTDYSFEARKAIEGPHAALILQTFQPDAICDVGCGRNYILIRLLRGLGFTNVMGIDPACNPVAWSTPFLFDDDISDPSFVVGSRSDLVICREVLEHLTIQQIAQAVRNLCALSSRFVYVTTRFHPKPSHLLDVATSDDLDPTHITMLNQNFLRLLFVLEGFTRRADLEQRMDWKKLGRVLVYERH